METKEVVQTLYAIPIGTFIAWGIVIIGIITAIVAATIKLYKAFEKTHEIKEENIEYKKMVNEHENQLKEVKDVLQSILAKLDEQDKLEFSRLRYSIVRAGEEYVSLGSITIRQLRSLEEMYEKYHNKHGNSYVTTLMRKVRLLPVVGTLDENDDDENSIE